MLKQLSPRCHLSLYSTIMASVLGCNKHNITPCTMECNILHAFVCVGMHSQTTHYHIGMHIADSDF